MTQTRPDGGAAWLAAFASLVLISFGMASSLLLFVSLKPITLEMDWPRSVPSFAYALQMLGTGLGGIVMGRWADRSHVALPVAVGVVLIPAGILVASRADEPWELFLAYGLMIGFLGQGALFAPLMANATRWFRRKRGLAVAIVASGQSVGGAVWPTIIEGLNVDIGWRGTFVAFAGVSLLGMLPMLLALKRRPPVQDDIGVARAGRAVGQSGFSYNLPHLVMMAAIFSCCMTMSMPIVHLVAHATDLGIDPTRAALLLSVLLAVSFVGRLGIGFLADRIGGLTAIVIASAAQALGMVGILASGSLVPLMLSAALFGAGMGGLVPVYAVVLREVYPAAEAGARLGAIFLFGTLGMALGNQVAGTLFDVTGSYGLAFAIGVGFNALNLALLASLWLMTRRPGGAVARA